MKAKQRRHPMVMRLPITFLSLLVAFVLLFGSALNSGITAGVGDDGNMLGLRQAYGVTSAEKQAEVDAALSSLDALQTEINKIATDYQAAEAAHTDAKERMIIAKAREEEAAVRISALQKQLGTRAQHMYRNGQISFLDVLFGAESFTDFITALDLINRVNNADAKLVEETRVVRTEAEAARIEFATQARIAQERQDEIGALMREKETASANMAAQIEQLQAETAELLVQEELQAEAARKAAANSGTSSVAPVTDAQLARVYALGLQFPLAGYYSTSSGFGWRSFDNSFHKGADFGAPTGTPILAAAGGTVIHASYGWNGGMGNSVIVSHGNGIRTIYMHASTLNSSAGQAVNGGDVIAYVGNTGNSFGAHLHFQVEVDGIAVNPMLFI